MHAAEQLADKGILARVVSMPCAEIFSAQDADYRDSVLPPSVRARVAVEALHADYWYQVCRPRWPRCRHDQLW